MQKRLPQRRLPQLSKLFASHPELFHGECPDTKAVPRGLLLETEYGEIQCCKRNTNCSYQFYNPNRMANRHRFRAEWYDYNDGMYFVTICCANKSHYLARIHNSEIRLTKIGYIAENCIKQISSHHKFKVDIIDYVIMPNHIHMIIYIETVGAQYIAPCPNTGALKPPMYGRQCDNNHFNSKLAIVIRTYKAAVSRMVATSQRAQCIAPLQLWQRNYHEHIIRDQHSFDNIINYIDTNVEKWDSDCFNIQQI